MSVYVNKGTIGATVIVSLDPDLSGNFVCDGTNDHTQIQAAIDRVDSLGGGSVYVKRGTYDIGAPLDIDQYYISLRGDGKSTILRAQNGLDDNVIEMTGAGKWFQEIRDLQVYGNKASMASGHGIYISHTYSSHDSNILLNNLWLHDVEDYGVYIVDGTGTREVHMNNVLVSAPNDGGFRLGGTDHKLVDCVSENPQNHGFYIPTTLQLTGCKSFGAGKDGSGYGFYITNVSNGQVMLANCWAQDCDGHGFSIWDTNYAQLVGCLADSNDEDGFRIDASQENGSQYNILSGCQSFDRAGGLFGQAVGIHLCNNSANNIVGDSIGEGVAGITDTGTNNRVHVCYNNGVYIP